MTINIVNFILINDIIVDIFIVNIIIVNTIISNTTIIALWVSQLHINITSRLPPAEPATADPGTDCAAAKPHVTNTLSVSPGDFVWNF